MERSSGRVDKWHEKKCEYLAGLANRGISATLGARRGARWASTPSGVVGILGASEHPAGDHWWFGIREHEFRERQAIGVILLCESEHDVLDFGLTAARLLELLPRLGADRRSGERKLNLVRRDERYLLQIPGESPVDVTDARHDVKWLLGSGDPAASATSARHGSPKVSASAAETYHFFAQVKGGVLKPLDPVDLQDGEILLVEARRVATAPGHASVRRIVAAGGPAELPRDFATRHDVYAHGASQR